MGGLRKVGRGLEANGFEERSCPSAPCAHAQFGEALPGVANRTIQERAADAPLAIGRQHIDPPDAPNLMRCGVRIETHPADRDDAIVGDVCQATCVGFAQATSITALSSSASALPTPPG